ESRAGVPLLNSLGVHQNHFTTTGDDAIELVYKNRSENLGNGIGVNLRFSQYSSVNQEMFGIVRSALQEVAKKKDAPLVPVPISHHSHYQAASFEEPDSASIRRLLAGYDDSSDGGQTLDTPLKVIKQAGNCRVVVTGSYHAGVFALSQGIPVVGLAKSEYYVDKFLGLADQFGIGCQTVLLNDQQLRERLVDSITNAWESSEKWRPQILESAHRQMELSQTAYKRVYEMVNSYTSKK
ncbi:MAG TPA: polysaccharide pyruvyl transferase family protein, partial [Coleofasciculaceae cyanobacterium]